MLCFHNYRWLLAALITFLLDLHQNGNFFWIKKALYELIWPFLEKTLEISLDLSNMEFDHTAFWGSATAGLGTRQADYNLSIVSMWVCKVFHLLQISTFIKLLIIEAS